MSESRDGLLVVVLVLVLAALVGVIVWKLPAGQQVMAYLRPQASTPPEASPPSLAENEEPKQAEARKPRASAAKLARESAQSGLVSDKLPLASSTASSQSTAKMVAMRYRTPAIEEMLPGMARQRLLSDYGQPNLRTVAVDSGRMVETYVFLKDQEREAVIARLYNGKLVNATTTPY